MRKQQKKPTLQRNESIKIRRLEDEFSKSEVQQFDADTELWESEKLGASAEHAKRIPYEQEKALDDALGLQLISVRIQKSLIERLRGLAKLEGMGYQTFMRQVLTNYVRENEYKLEQLLMPNQLAAKAEQLFMQALKYKEVIPTLKAMSNERISMEHNYSVELGKANELFCKAYENCHEAVLKKHLKLRMHQITQLCNEQLEHSHNKKYKKAG